MITKKDGYAYICGKKALAESIFNTFIEIFVKYGHNKYDSIKLINSMKVNNKYHEDVFSN